MSSLDDLFSFMFKNMSFKMIVKICHVIYPEFLHLFSLFGITLHFFYCSCCASTQLNGAIEQKYLEKFFRSFFLEEDFSYTLFGEKPMSLSGVQKNSLELIEKIYQLVPSATDLSLSQAIDYFKKYKASTNNDYLFIFNEYPNEKFVYFIQKNIFLKTIDENIDIFLKELGEDFVAEVFLREIAKEDKYLLDLIHYHEGILGILLGYGRHNSLLFQKKADSLGRCWGYDLEIRKLGTKYFCTNKIISREKEINDLNSKLSPFSEEWEYCDMTSISPLGFGADLNHPETKNLKEKYSSLRNKINETYSQTNPFELIQKMLGLSEVEEPGHKWLRDSSSFSDFDRVLHGSPNPVLKNRDCGLANVQSFLNQPT